MPSKEENHHFPQSWRAAPHMSTTKIITLFQSWQLRVDLGRQLKFPGPITQTILCRLSYFFSNSTMMFTQLLKLQAGLAVQRPRMVSLLWLAPRDLQSMKSSLWARNHQNKEEWSLIVYHWSSRESRRVTLDKEGKHVTCYRCKLGLDQPQLGHLCEAFDVEIPETSEMYLILSQMTR